MESKKSTKNNSCVNKIYISYQGESFFVDFIRRYIMESKKSTKNYSCVNKNVMQEELYFVDFLPPLLKSYPFVGSNDENYGRTTSQWLRS